MSEQPSVDNPNVTLATDSHGKQRYEINVGSPQDPVGFTEFKEHHAAGQKQGIFPHTEVSEDFGGLGLASKLVRHALDRAIADGYQIVAVCPYIKKWIEKHPEYQEHAVKPRPEHFEALR